MSSIFYFIAGWLSSIVTGIVVIFLIHKATEHLND